VAYRDDRDALLARNASLESDLARAKSDAARARAEARKLKRDLGVLTRALGVGTVVQGSAAARFLPLIVASLVGAATLIGVNVGRVRQSCPVPPARIVEAQTVPKHVPLLKHDTLKTALVPAGMGLLTLQTNVRARLVVDGRHVGMTPVFDALLPAGVHRVVVTARGHEPVSSDVMVTSGRRVTMTATLPDADPRVPLPYRTFE
jgi:hypothetical protein